METPLEAVFIYLFGTYLDKCADYDCGIHLGADCGRYSVLIRVFFFFQAEDGIRDVAVTGVQTCALPISLSMPAPNGLLGQGRDMGEHGRAAEPVELFAGADGKSDARSAQRCGRATRR